MANLSANRVRKTKRDSRWYIVDNAGVEVALSTLADVGNVSMNIGDYDHVNIMERGEFKGRRRVDDQPSTFSAELNWLGTTSTSEASLFDLVYWGKNASSYAYLNLVPTNGATADVPQWSLRNKIEGTAHGDSADHQFTLTHVRLRITGGAESGENMKLTLEGEGFGFSIDS